jgi:flagellar biosynthesis chaperone FliJ
MPSIHNIRSQAETIANGSSDGDLAQLAQVVKLLAKECEELEDKLKKSDREIDQLRHQVYALRR